MYEASLTRAAICAFHRHGVGGEVYYAVAHEVEAVGRALRYAVFYAASVVATVSIQFLVST